MNRITKQKWFPNAIAVVIGVVVYVALTHISAIGNAAAALLNVVYPLIAGAVIAYLINPLMRFFEKKLFGKLRKDKIRKNVSLGSSYIIVAVVLIFLIDTLIPQIYQSIASFTGNIDSYINKLDIFLQNTRMSWIKNNTVVKELFFSSKSIFERIAEYVSKHGDEIENTVSLLGGHITAWVLGLILSIYYLADKEKIKLKAKALVRRIKKNNAEYYISYFRKCDEIMSKYIIYSLIEAVIIGGVNAIFMWICGMQYIGLVSVIVGVTNLIPAFGPIIGGVTGCFVLLLTSPLHALLFIIFTVIFQTIDGYILKPKMFGETFGVSGLWILIAIIIGSRLMGIIGILMSIPAAAIVELSIKTWKEYDLKQEIEKSASDVIGANEE